MWGSEICTTSASFNWFVLRKAPLIFFCSRLKVLVVENVISCLYFSYQHTGAETWPNKVGMVLAEVGGGHLSHGVHFLYQLWCPAIFYSTMPRAALPTTRYGLLIRPRFWCPVFRWIDMVEFIIIIYCSNPSYCHSLYTLGYPSPTCVCLCVLINVLKLSK